MDTRLIVSASPHLRSEETTTSLMANVIVALTPCVVASAIIFGWRALLVTAVSVVACVVFEWLYCKLLKKPNPIGDLSAVVTGIILAMNVPVGMPLGQLIVGDLVAIVLGLIYLVVTKTISIAIPAAYVGSMFLFYLIATHSVHAALVAVLSGGLLFGAVFMATDYVTSPFTLKGKLVYGVALGVVTFAIRYWGSYTEGVSFALLFMNLWVPYINDLTRQTPYGYVKPAKKEAAGK